MGRPRGNYKADAPPRDQLHSEFAQLIDQALARKGWSRSDLARVMGVTPPHISNVLNRPEKLALNVMLSIAEAAGVTLGLRDHRAIGRRKTCV